MASLTILQSILLLSSSLLTIISPSCAVTKTVVAAICSQTQNQESCEKILQSDPRTVSADLSQLSLISLNQQMEGIIDKATELSEKKQYEKITELGQLTTLTYNCANGVPLDSPTVAINEDMLLMSETASSVNSFIVGS